jgi:integrase
VTRGEAGFHDNSLLDKASPSISGKLDKYSPLAQPPKCPQCNSQKIYRDGLRYLTDGKTIQRWLCRECSYRFSRPKPLQENPEWRLNTPSTLLSKRQVCELLTEESKNLAEVTRQETAPREGTTTINPKTEFAEQLRRDGYSNDTIKQCNHYLNLFEKKGINILRPEDVKTFIADQKWQPHSKATAVTMYGIFASYMHLHWAPPRYKYDQKIPFVPTEKEIDDLIAGTGKKTSLLLRLLKETGARVTEALRLKWTDIDLTKGTVAINNPEKNSLPRILKISPTLIALLNTLSKESDYVINRCRNTVESNYQHQRNKLARKLGNPRLKQIHLHTFRHFYATMLFAKTLNLPKVQQALGHKYLTNTQIYIQLVDFESDEYDVQVAENLEEAKKLLEAGFDYITEMDGRKLFRKRK